MFRGSKSSHAEKAVSRLFTSRFSGSADRFHGYGDTILREHLILAAGVLFGSWGIIPERNYRPALWRKPKPLLQHVAAGLLEAFFLADDLGNAHAVVPFDDDHFTARNDTVIY